MTTTSVQSIWLLLLDDTLWNPIARCTRCKNLRYARIAWEILRRNFIQSKLSTNWSPKKDQGATTGLLCVLQNGSPIFHSFLDTMLTQNTWCWWAGGVPWCHHFVGSNPHGCYHFVGVPIPFCRGVGWAPYTLVGPSSRGEFQGGGKLDVLFMTFKGPPEPSRTNNLSTKWKGAITSTSMFMILWHYHFVAGSCWFKTYFVRISSAKLHGFVGGDCGGCLCNRLGNGDPT